MRLFALAVSSIIQDPKLLFKNFRTIGPCFICPYDAQGVRHKRFQAGTLGCKRLDKGFLAVSGTIELRDGNRTKRDIRNGTRSTHNRLKPRSYMYLEKSRPELWIPQSLAQRL